MGGGKKQNKNLNDEFSQRLESLDDDHGGGIKNHLVAKKKINSLQRARTMIVVHTCLKSSGQSHATMRDLLLTRQIIYRSEISKIK